MAAGRRVSKRHPAVPIKRAGAAAPLPMERLLSLEEFRRRETHARGMVRDAQSLIEAMRAAIAGSPDPSVNVMPTQQIAPVQGDGEPAPPADRWLHMV